MSQSGIGRWIGVALLGGGLALGALARRADQEVRAAADREDKDDLLRRVRNRGDRVGGEYRQRQPFG